MFGNWRSDWDCAGDTAAEATNQITETFRKESFSRQQLLNRDSAHVDHGQRPANAHFSPDEHEHCDPSSRSSDWETSVFMIA
jgi:hypothetical protein